MAKEWSNDVKERVIGMMREGVPFNRFLGIEVAELRSGFARLEIPFRPELIGNPLLSALHGGVISALIDVAGGAAAMTQIALGDMLSTIDLRIDYLRPGQPHRLAAEAHVLRMGGRVASVDMKAFHPEGGTVVATGRGVYNVRRIRLPDAPPGA
jgi:uncharacterized protein (TIGR00369 family)